MPWLHIKHLVSQAYKLNENGATHPHNHEGVGGIREAQLFDPFRYENCSKYIDKYQKTFENSTTKMITVKLKIVENLPTIDPKTASIEVKIEPKSIPNGSKIHQKLMPKFTAGKR